MSTIVVSLVACRDSAHNEDVRTYRVDRIDTVNIDQDSPGAETLEFDLVAYWDEHIKEIEAFQSSVAGTIRAPLWTRPRPPQSLRQLHDRDLDGVHISARWTFHRRGACNLGVSLAEQLAGWGRRIEVLDPPQPRSEMGESAPNSRHSMDQTCRNRTLNTHRASRSMTQCRRWGHPALIFTTTYSGGSS